MEGGAWGSLPGSSRAWLYTADRVLTVEEQNALRAGIESFLTEWVAHGQSQVKQVQHAAPEANEEQQAQHISAAARTELLGGNFGIRRPDLGVGLVIITAA